MLVHWIWLSTRPKLNDREKAQLIGHFHDPEDIYYADPGALALEGLDQEALEALQDKNLIPAEEILNQCADKQIHLLTYRDAAYPSKLKNISDPPLVLYYKGRLPDFDGAPLIGVVGTRQATAYGIGVAKRMGYQIARCGGIVVSGAATGIDGAAMQGALSANGEVVGILGCGVDIIYPRSNRGLFLDTERRGCLLSELPPGTEPFKWNFPKRNRLISGLSCGVLIVEAPEKSGALITARQAADQGRDVFVVPGNIDVPSCAGSNALLRDGAIAVSSGWDVISEYEGLYPDKIHKDQSPCHMAGYPDELANRTERTEVQVAQRPRLSWKKTISKAKKDKKPIDNGAEPPYSELIKDKKTDLTEQEQKLLALLSGGERLVDDVIAESGMASGTVLAVLTMLEIKGAVTRLPGRRICRKGQKP